MTVSCQVALIRSIQPRYLSTLKAPDSEVSSKYVGSGVNIDKEAQWLYATLQKVTGYWRKLHRVYVVTTLSARTRFSCVLLQIEAHYLDFSSYVVGHAVGLTTPAPGFDASPLHLGFVVVKITLGQVFLRVLRVFLFRQYHSIGAPRPFIYDGRSQDRSNWESR